MTGTFRRTEKNIGIDPLQIAIQLRILLDDAAFWIEHQTYDPLEFAARLHRRLVCIHLFPNGNGRHARIMADAILTKMLDHSPIDWAGGANLNDMSERRSRYLSSLRRADRGDFLLLIDFVSGRINR